jgi:hypothetical protein
MRNQFRNSCRPAWRARSRPRHRPRMAYRSVTRPGQAGGFWSPPPDPARLLCTLVAPPNPEISSNRTAPGSFSVHFGALPVRFRPLSVPISLTCGRRWARNTQNHDNHEPGGQKTRRDACTFFLFGLARHWVFTDGKR